MEFSSIWYFSFWSLISVVFSAIGIYALDKATIPGSLMLELCFLLSVTTVSGSISYAFLFRPALEELQDEANNKILFYLFSHPSFTFGVICILVSLPNEQNIPPGFFQLSVAAIFLSSVHLIKLGFKYSLTFGNFFTGLAGPLRMYPYYTLSWVLFQGFLWLFLRAQISFLWLSLAYCLFTSVFSPVIFSESKQLIATSSAAACVYQQRRFVEIVCGMLANTLAQYYFRVQSLPLMLASLSFAIAWLGNLANVQPNTDFGIFQFLVSMSAQYAVSLYGLHFYTLLVVLAGIAMMVLRWKMESVSLKHFGKQESVARDWRRLQAMLGEQPNTPAPAATILEQPNTSAATATILEQPNTSAAAATILEQPNTSAAAAAILDQPNTSAATATILEQPNTSAATATILEQPNTSAAAATILEQPNTSAATATIQILIA